MARAGPRRMQQGNQPGETMTTDDLEDPAKPVLTEDVSDAYGDYQQQWYCQPPAKGIPFRVTDCTWTPDHKVRKIFEVAIGQGSQRRQSLA